MLADRAAATGLRDDRAGRHPGAGATLARGMCRRAGNRRRRAARRRAPFAFFFGRVAAGRPRTGLVMLASGNMIEIRGVANDGTIVPTDDENAPEQDRAWANAVAGARLVAGRFGAAGSKASAAYYTGWAHRIATQRPE